MATAHLIHGFVGTGKTTYATKLEYEIPALRFSIDDWIVALYGQNPPEEDFSDIYYRTSRLIWDVAVRALALGQDVIMDFGFWSRASRDDARQRVLSTGAEVILYHVTCADDIMRARVLKRTAQMPAKALYIDSEAIESFYNQLEPLDADEHHQLIQTDP